MIDADEPSGRGKRFVETMATGGQATVERQRIGGRYDVEASLGRGGMGNVLRVRDGGRVVALKQIAAAEATEDMQLRFRREFHTMASLAHPRIVEVMDYGVDRGAPYYTMELLDGQDLADLDRVPWRRAVEVLHDVAMALAFLHGRGLLHRDLAPRNVRCTADGRAKLIDFGVLATTGIAGDVAGTPPFMAPEGLRGQSLDHRYDLFGLGALAYRVLTGTHAYPARSLEELESAWRVRPPRPIELVPELPPALDELVVSLIALDPLARPSNAVDVVDRLAAIGELDRATDIAVTRSWIASAALIGRQREMQQLRRVVERAGDGHGGSLLIEAPSGIGKTRLLRELALEAQLAGMTVARAEGSVAGPYGVVHELARGLFAAAPDAAERAARRRGSTLVGAAETTSRPAMLARVITELRTRLDVEPARAFGDPAEDRMRLQQELAAWLLDIAAIQPFALCVDDVQRCDEASAAVLAAVAHQASSSRLLVAAALRVDEPVRAPAPIAALCDAGQRIRLRGLDEPELCDLCRSFFGDVPHLPRLAHWMHTAVGGSPLAATELARHLIDRGTIRYADGLWMIPDELDAVELPSGLAEALDARVRSLPADVRGLGEVLAVHGGELPLSLIVELGDRDDEREVFAALDRLALDEILVHAGDSWQFRHDGLREAMLRGLDPERLRALHRRVGDALERRAERSVERDAEIGWHLHAGGDPERGAILLERAGRALYDAQSFADCIAPLEAALSVCEAGKTSARARLELRHMLLMAGCMADRKTALAHAGPCIAGFRYWSGVDVAQRARKVVGRHLAVGIGLMWAAVRWVFSPRRGPNPYEAFRTFFIVVGYAATIHSMSFDFEGTARMVELVEPIAIFKNRVPYAVYLLTCNTSHFPRGQVGIAERNSRRILEILEHDRLTPIRDIDRRTGGGGARYMLALGNVMNLTPTLARDLEDLRHLGLTFFDIGADQAMVVFHRVRGEEQRATELEAGLEMRFVQLGSVWQMEAFMPVIASLAYAFVRDTLGLRRTIEQLDAMSSDGFCYQPLLELARGEYLRERGDLAGSAELLVPLVARDDFPMTQIAALCALAETMLALGDHERARGLAEKCVAVSSSPDVHNLHGEVRGVRALALAEAALGRVGEAAERLDAALASVADRESPLLSGCLHEARARVALLAGEHRVFHHHHAETSRLFRSTRNPALIARAERLAAAAESHRPPRLATDAEPGTEVSAPRPHRDVSVVSVDAVTMPEVRSRVSFASCRGAGERAQRALQLLVDASRATSGYLYLLRGDSLELVAPIWGDEPPSQLARALASSLRSPAEPATVAELPSSTEFRGSKSIVLAPSSDARPIGGALVIGGALPLVDPDPALVVEVARALFEAGDVTGA